MTSRAAWQRIKTHRVALERRALQTGETTCPGCDIEMRFTFESPAQARARLGLHRRAQVKGRTATADHIVPQSLRFSSHAKQNIMLLCKQCNRMKRNMTVPEWLAARWMRHVPIARRRHLLQLHDRATLYGAQSDIDLMCLALAMETKHTLEREQ